MTYKTDEGIPDSEKGIFPHSRRAVGTVVNCGFWIYGGFGLNGSTKPDDIGSDLWQYQNRWRKIPGPGPYAARYVSLCAISNGFYMFGGCGFNGSRITFYNELWFYNGKWKQIVISKGDMPEGRYTCALASIGNQLIMFGGQSQTPNGEKQFFGDLWKFDFIERIWNKIHGDEIGPGKRYGFGWSSHRNHLYIFGGYDGRNDLGDLWDLNLETFTWEKLAHDGPEPRYCPAMGSVNDSLILFGGRSKVNPKLNFSDTWIFRDGWKYCKYENEDMSPGYHAKPGYASDGKAMWIFGGEGPNGHISDLWKFDRSGWRRLHGNREDDPILW